MGNIASYPVSVEIASSGTSATTSGVPVEGLLKGLSIEAPDLDDSDTYTVTITDANSGQIFNRASLSENTTTDIWTDSNNYPLETPFKGDVSVKITASGSQASARSFTVYVYYAV